MSCPWFCLYEFPKTPERIYLPGCPAQPATAAMGPSPDVALPPRPWHMVNLWWDFHAPAASASATHIAIDVTVDRDVSTAHNLYIAPAGLGELGGQRFYGGLQSNINGWPGAQAGARVHAGKGAIFSRWAAGPGAPVGLDHVRVLRDGLCESAGYEGEFCSVRRPYAWTKGVYTWSVRKGDAEVVRGKPETWWVCEVKDHASGRVTEIGSLRFAGDTFTYWDRHCAFVEVYATSQVPESDIPACHVTFGMPRVNGIEPPLKGARVHYPRESGPVSPPCVRTVEDGRSIRCEVGPIVSCSEMDCDRVLRLS